MIQLVKIGRQNYNDLFFQFSNWPMRNHNPFSELETFLAVVEEGSFSAAARARGMTPSAVSKMMARLENRLGAMLLKRSTRKLQVTDEGQRFARRAAEILDALAAAEREAGCSDVAGIVRIATSSAYANHILAPILGDLLRAHPELEIELIIGDQISDLYSQPVDLAVRAGPLPDSSVLARSLGRSELVEVVASAHAGDPHSIRGGFAYGRRDKIWTNSTARLRANDGTTLAALAAGSGITVRAGLFVVADDLAAGRLVRVDQALPAYEEFHILYLGRLKALPRRVSVVLDHIQKFGRVDRNG